MLNLKQNFEELDELSEEERQYALSILKDLADAGTSKRFNDLLTEDYEEVPVDVETFLRDPQYLGKGLIDESGRFTVYDYWISTLKKIFPDPLKPAQYNTLALTGAIGLGKSFMAVLCGLYELYRMLCLKDPYLHYSLQPIDKITFAFMNITLDASKGVAWDKLQQLVQLSPWFMSHGQVSGTTNVEWKPGKRIELIAGSLSRHILGRAVYFCLDGDTVISTNIGDFPISTLENITIRVQSIDNNGNVVLSDECTVKKTATSSIEYQIELEDDTIIKCTPEHRFRLMNGEYKEAQYLTEFDELLEFEPVGYIYKTTNIINGDVYIGQHKKKFFNKNYHGSGLRIIRSMNKYGFENFRTEFLSWAKTIDELNDLERKYISECRLSGARCINISDGALGGHENYNHSSKPSGGNNAGCVLATNGFKDIYVCDKEHIPEGYYLGSKRKGVYNPNYKLSWTDDRRKIQSDRLSGKGNPQYGKGCFGENNGRFGKPTSDETKQKIGNANRGRQYSKEVNMKKGRPGQKKPKGFSETCSKVQSKYIYEIDDKTIYGLTNLIAYLNDTYNCGASAYLLDKHFKGIDNSFSKNYDNILKNLTRKENNYYEDKKHKTS